MQSNEQYTTLTCPNCGDTKKIFNMVCADLINKEFWSDLYRIQPYAPRISAVQKCHHCGMYYFAEEEQCHYVDIEAEVETLNYTELKEAKKQFASSDLSLWQKTALGMELVWAYNDEFCRGRNDNKPTKEDEKLFQELIDFFAGTVPRYFGDQVFDANLLCQVGDYVAAKQLLEQITDKNAAYVVKAMLHHIDLKSTFPIKVISDFKVVE